MQKRTLVIGITAILVILLGAILMLISGDGGGDAGREEVPLSELVSSETFSKGADSAPITIVEFSDFQCPACGAQYREMKKFLSDFPGKVKFYYRHLPLPQHEHALSAAAAAEAAGLQGKFWEMHDQIFEHQDKLDEESVRLYAGALGLDEQQFERDRKSKEISSKIDEDRRAAEALRIQSTPTSFINGRRFVGVLTYEELRTEIQTRSAQ